MRLSQFFMPTLRETPAEAEVVSHRLMLRAGMIRQSAAGIYTWLPLGLRVLRKIEAIVREEQNAAGAQELLMPTIQPADLWRESGRYDDYGKEMLRITDRHDRDMLYGPTNEELITDIFRRDVKSYRDLPKSLYHIQWKFRDEVRPRFGVMRGREFLMKDTYSFDLDADGARQAYNRMFIAYLRTFERMGLKAVPMAADTGPIGGDLSHEFHILAETGESEAYLHGDYLSFDPIGDGVGYDDDLQPLVDKWTSLYAAADDKHDAVRFVGEVPEAKRVEARGIEVGHIFYFGTKYSEAMGATVQDADGKSVPVQMGSYGIGVSRLVAAIIEASHDDDGIIWPASVAPFDVGLLNLKPGNEATDGACKTLYDGLTKFGIDVLYDDRKNRPGAKFASMDLIGLPVQIICGPREAEQGRVELKDRSTGAKQTLSVLAALEYLTRDAVKVSA